MCTKVVFTLPLLAPEAVEAECRVDNDCPPRLACIEAECVDPCLRRPCHADQTCSVQNSAPLRTVICSCPENTFVGPNGECKPKGITEGQALLRLGSEKGLDFDMTIKAVVCFHLLVENLRRCVLCQPAFYLVIARIKSKESTNIFKNLDISLDAALVP
jgi:hypothetical protein